MTLLTILIVLSICKTSVSTCTTVPPSPNWEKIDTRPIPLWYDKVKIGIFIHWGVYSVPSVFSEWFWHIWKDDSHKKHKELENFMKKNYKPGFSYQDFAHDFTAEFYNASEWANLIEKSGAKYAVLTSKHHDGFALWPSKYSFSWNARDVGPHRDLIGELRQELIKKKGIRFGVYHSLYEWFNPLYLRDKQNNFTTQEFINKIFPEMQELVLKYKPEIFWSDGEWEADSTYWKSIDFLTWLYDESPVADSVVVNDRWGHDATCKHGGYLTCSDRFNPGTLQKRKWENAMTIDKNSWGFDRTSKLTDYLSPHELIKTVVATVACGGNVLINIGPSKDGTISTIFEERLLQLGKWLKVNGEAIYESQPWEVCQNDTTTPNVWYTSKNNGSTLYSIMFEWPTNNILYLTCAEKTETSIITMLGVGEKLGAKMTDKKMLKIALPDKAKVKNDWAWTIKITNVLAP